MWIGGSGMEMRVKSMYTKRGVKSTYFDKMCGMGMLFAILFYVFALGIKVCKNVCPEMAGLSYPLNCPPGRDHLYVEH